MKKIEVVAGIISFKGKILCVQRNTNKYDYISKKFEFPGGKLEINETLENALTREIKEELKMDIIVKDKFLTVNHDYPDFSLRMHSFLCDAVDGNFTLTEHISYQWLDINNLNGLDWAAADLPIVAKLIDQKNG